jgi:ribulose 1,5-bisphosphate carboxylase large subunit-like protein
MRMLDSYGLSAVDFIKLDCEGYELFALRGAEETIKRWMPVITVEQKPGHGQQFGLGDTDAVRWLLKRGYKLAQELGGDYIMVPK